MSACKDTFLDPKKFIFIHRMPIFEFPSCSVIHLHISLYIAVPFLTENKFNFILLLFLSAIFVIWLVAFLFKSFCFFSKDNNFYNYLFLFCIKKVLIQFKENVIKKMKGANFMLTNIHFDNSYIIFFNAFSIWEVFFRPKEQKS